MKTKVDEKCLNIQPLLYAYVDNELSDEQFEAVSAHLSECGHCKNEIANIYKIKDMVKLAYGQKEEVNFSKKIMAGIAFNNKYGKKNQPEKLVSKNKVSAFYKMVAGKLVYISAIAVALLLVIGATVTYFEKSKPVTAEVAAKTYDKYEDYVLEHYANSYSGPIAQASVISVNFEK